MSSTGGKEKKSLRIGEDFPKFAEFYYRFVKTFDKVYDSKPELKRRQFGDFVEGHLPDDLIIACLLMYKHYAQAARFTPNRKQLAKLYVDLFFGPELFNLNEFNQDIIEKVAEVP